MRSAGNFNPEWGYLAPAPSFMRTLRVVLVATAVGATAGAAVVISLIDRPSAVTDKTASATARATVTSVRAAPAVAAPPLAAAAAAPIKVTSDSTPGSTPPAVAAPSVAPQIAAPAAAEHAAPPVAAAPTQSATIAQPQASPSPQASHVAAVPESSAADTPKPANGIAALSYAASPADDEHGADLSDQGMLRPELADKKAKHHAAGGYAANGKDKPTPNLGSFLRRIFSPHPAGSSYYPNR